MEEEIAMDTFIFQVVYFIICCFVTFFVAFLIKYGEDNLSVKEVLKDMKYDIAEFYILVLILEFSNLTAFFITKSILN